MHVVKKREKIIVGIKKQQTRYLKKSHKFSIELPKTVKQTYALDAKNGIITLWADAISKKRGMTEWHLKLAPIGHQFV